MQASKSLVSVYFGKLPRVNIWHSARVVFPGGKPKAMIYESPQYHALKNNLISAFKKDLIPQPGYFDLQIIVAQYRQADSDSTIKPVFDALEKAGICVNDNRIRNFSVCRKYHKKSEEDMLIVRIIEISEADIVIAKSEMKRGVLDVDPVRN